VQVSAEQRIRSEKELDNWLGARRLTREALGPRGAFVTATVRYHEAGSRYARWSLGTLAGVGLLYACGEHMQQWHMVVGIAVLFIAWAAASVRYGGFRVACRDAWVALDPVFRKHMPSDDILDTTVGGYLMGLSPKPRGNPPGQNPSTANIPEPNQSPTANVEDTTNG
jgi:hypothetical protein